MKLVQLTSPDGHPVFINPDMVEMIRLNDTAQAVALAKSVLQLTSGGTLAVLEDVATVISKLEGT
jgi:uncharacterized protein YlzI (FlbEa/FlbD family)